MENDNKNEKKSKLSLSPEQIDKGAEALGKFAEKTDNFYDNVKGKLGSSGKVIGFAVLATLICNNDCYWFCANTSKKIFRYKSDWC
jgi:hypothetical protein